MHVLTDFDPDGLAIFNVYKYGSGALDHESRTSLCPHAVRIGLNMDQIKDMGDPMLQQELLPLTARDRRRANLMLTLAKSRDSRQAQHLQVMLMLNVKVELQILENNGGASIGLLESLCTSDPF